MCQSFSIGCITVPMYQTFNVLSIIVLFVFFAFNIKRLNISPLKAKRHGIKRERMLCICVVLTVFATGFALLNVLYKLFGNWFTHGNANYYGTLTAWMIAFFVVPILYGISPLIIADELSPGLPVTLFFAKLACFFHGCCSGFELPNSFYFNQYTEKYEFPVQLVEALVALALFFFILWYKRKNRIPGSAFPVYLILYSGSRFLTEFLRADFPNVLGPFDAYQVMSFVFLLIGLLLFYFVWFFKYESEKAKSKKKQH